MQPAILRSNLNPATGIYNVPSVAPSLEVGPQNYSKGFFAVCKNWATEVSKEKQISVEEAYEVISKLVREKASDSAKKQEFLIVLNTVGWENHPLFDNTEEYPYYALSCLQEGSITSEQFATLMFYREGVLYHESKADLTSVPLFITDLQTKERKINPIARQIITQTFAPIKAVNQQFPQLTEQEVDQFFKEMSKKPVSEQQFFVMPDTYKPKHEVERVNIRKIGESFYKDKKDYTPEQLKAIEESFENNSVLDEVEKIMNTSIVESLHSLQGFNVFNFFEEETRKRMIPSCGMMQAFLNTKYKKPVQLNPVIGLSPNSAIYDNAVNRTRELALAFVDKKLPNSADTKSAPGFDFTYHDFYHACVLSLMPESHVEGVFKLTEILEKLQVHPQLKNFTAQIEQYKNALLDLEGILYQETTKKWSESDIPVLFWKYIDGAFTTAITEFSEEKDLSLKFADGGKKAMELNESGFYQMINKAFQENEEFFKTKGILLSDTNQVYVEQQQALSTQATKILDSQFRAVLGAAYHLFITSEQVEEAIKKAANAMAKIYFMSSLYDGVTREKRL